MCRFYLFKKNEFCQSVWNTAKRNTHRGDNPGRLSKWTLDWAYPYPTCCCCCWVTSVVSDSVWPHRLQPTRLPCPWDSPGKTTGVGCHFLLQCVKVKVKLLSCVRLLATPWTAAYQAPPSMGFSRQEYWSGVPLPSPLPYIALFNSWASEFMLKIKDSVLHMREKLKYLCETRLNRTWHLYLPY